MKWLLLRWWQRSLLVSVTLLSLCGCDTLSYFGQAAAGQWQILHQRQPIDDLLANDNTDPELKHKLAIVRQARLWATTELHLESGGSYSDYVALDRPYVVWNVVAAPEFSVAPAQWCFPIAGCVAYRGYFREEEAQRYAATLQAQGMDTWVGGVEAYSTLGWFDDPVLSTFVKRPDAALAGLVFHELAHRTLYVQNDSTFNESFATVVEQEGLRRWLMVQRQPAQWQRYQQQVAYQKAFVTMILDYRKQLEALYAAPTDDNHKRAEKQQLAQQLRQQYQSLRDIQWQGYNGYDRWMSGSLNNAQVSTISTYHAYVPAFQALLDECDNALKCFYDRAGKLAGLDTDARKAAIAALNPSDTRQH